MPARVDPSSTPSLPAEGPEVSVILPTCNRPQMLARSLEHLCEKQTTTLRYEVVVVDNAPVSETVASVVSRFRNARLVEEPRRGLSYARNAGICAAFAPLIAVTDDDVVPPPNWLDAITAPLNRHAAVTGGISPLHADTGPELLFEAYGAHGIGNGAAIYGPEWLGARTWKLPLWEIGTTANAAFRAAVFRDPRVGLFDEALGAGSPVGSWEDLNFFYRLLRAGYSIERVASADVWHEHRASMADLTRQLAAYRRGEVAFCLLLLWCHHDPRGILHLLFWIPFWRAAMLLGEVGRRLRGTRLFPFRLMLREWRAYLAAPFALAQSLARVRASGRTPMHRPMRQE